MRRHACVQVDKHKAIAAAEPNFDLAGEIYTTVCRRVSVHQRKEEAKDCTPVLTWVCNYVSSCIQAGVNA